MPMSSLAELHRKVTMSVKENKKKKIYSRICLYKMDNCLRSFLNVILCKIKVIISNERFFTSKWLQPRYTHLLWEKNNFLIHFKISFTGRMIELKTLNVTWPSGPSRSTCQRLNTQKTCGSGIHFKFFPSHFTLLLENKIT